MQGTKLSHYQIGAALGAGGMGEVYRARDSKLDRDVAIKVLPADFASDPERLARFEREAKLLASLSHANIAAIYGLEDVDGVRFIAMELVEGETLAERVERKGKLELAEALELAGQIAAAFDAAHERGVIHRDLKPANIMVAPDGSVKVLDFGLAKARGVDTDASASGDPSASPTMLAATGAGMILGTAAYMSPEQAKGKALDKRADIWAFGVVLYEMLTGERLFAGEDLTETLASVVREEPDLRRLPGEVRRLVGKCLEKDPRARLRDIGDVWALLDAGPGQARPVVGASLRAAWAVAALMTVIAAAVAIVAIPAWLRPAPAGAPVRFQIPWPSEQVIASGGRREMFSLSPDGRFLAMADGDQLWLRPLDAARCARHRAHRRSYLPILVAGRRVHRLLRRRTAQEGLVGEWSGTDCLRGDRGTRGCLGSQRGDHLRRCRRGPATGLRAGWCAGGAHPVAAGELARTGRRTSIPPVPARWRALSLPVPDVRPGCGGHLRRVAGRHRARACARWPRGRTLRAAGAGGRHRPPAPAPAADPDGPAFRYRDATGPRWDVPRAERVGLAGNTGFAAFSVGLDGTLAFSIGTGGARVLNWIDRAGRVQETATEPAKINEFSISPGGRMLALGIEHPDRPGGDIVLQELPGSPFPFTFGSTPGWGKPVWSPDGSEIAFSTFDRAGLAEYEIRSKASDLSDTERRILSDAGVLHVWDWSPDGRFVLLTKGWTEGDLMVFEIDGDQPPVAVAAGPGDQTSGQFSPDGNWIAYASNESGRTQVYAQPHPTTGAVWQVSTSGGDMPRWRADGQELFYRSAAGGLMAVQVGAGSTNADGTAGFNPGSREVLFERVIANATAYFGGFAYEPAEDGQRFLVSDPATVSKPPVTVLLNWEATIQ